MANNRQGIRFGFHVQGQSQGSVEKAIEYAVLAEKSGFDTFTLPDHTFRPSAIGTPAPPLDLLAVLTAVGMKTRRLKLMPTVTEALRRHPAILAHFFATLDQMTKGRAVLAIGAGEAFNLKPLSDIEWDKPASKMEEAIRVIRLLWASTKNKPASFHGKHFRLEKAFLGLKPFMKTFIPIYVGGYGPRIRRIIGKIGDGWIPWMSTPETYERILKEIEANARKAGRDPSDIDPCIMLYTVVSKNGDRAWEEVGPVQKYALVLRNSLLRDLGYGGLAAELGNSPLWRMEFTAENMRKILFLSRKVPMDAVERVSISGTPDEAIEGIERYLRSGVKHVIVEPVGRHIEETAGFYRDVIIPYFRKSA